MIVSSYRLANGTTRWLYVTDLPVSADGHRRRKKRGFGSEQVALRVERELRATYAEVARISGWHGP